jgi:hypothetical protein
MKKLLCFFLLFASIAQAQPDSVVVQKITEFKFTYPLHQAVSARLYPTQSIDSGEVVLIKVPDDGVIHGYVTRRFANGSYFLTAFTINGGKLLINTLRDDLWIIRKRKRLNKTKNEKNKKTKAPAFR